jgi:hypothetical protein
MAIIDQGISSFFPPGSNRSRSGIMPNLERLFVNKRENLLKL